MKYTYKFTFDRYNNDTHLNKPVQVGEGDSKPVGRGGGSLLCGIVSSNSQAMCSVAGMQGVQRCLVALVLKLSAAQQCLKVVVSTTLKHRCAAVNFKAILNPSPPQTLHAERCSRFAKMAVIHAQLPLIAVWLVARCL